MTLPLTAEQQDWLANIMPAGKASVQKGYADRPGTGPVGETCGSCKHLVRKVMAKAYLKCGVMHRIWTGGAGTDIKARSPACSKWAPCHKDIPGKRQRTISGR